MDEFVVISRIIKVKVKVTETLIILDVTKTESNNNCFIIHWTTKNWIHVFASSLTASNTKCVNLTWLHLQIMHHSHTQHDYPWPWVSLTWLFYNLQLWNHGHWFWKFTVCFRPVRKELESSMYNNVNKQLMLVFIRRWCIRKVIMSGHDLGNIK